MLQLTSFFCFANCYHRQARAGVQELHFLPFNPTDKRTALTYLDSEGKMHRVSKGAPEQVWYLTKILFNLTWLFSCRFWNLISAFDMD